MDCGPVAVELLVGYFGEFVEVEGELDAGLDVGLGVVGELGVGECVVYFCECHGC